MTYTPKITVQHPPPKRKPPNDYVREEHQKQRNDVN